LDPSNRPACWKIASELPLNQKKGNTRTASTFWRAIGLARGELANTLQHQRLTVDQTKCTALNRRCKYFGHAHQERNIMRRSLEVRRQKLLQEIARVDREIEVARKSMERVEMQIAAIQQPSAKAA
jgi:hypothetical protein